MHLHRRGRFVCAPAVCVVVVVLLGSLSAHAQGVKNFRITWNVEKTNPNNTEIAGRVVNESRLEAFDVYVTAEALDERGKVLARGLSHVSPMMRPAASEPFVAKVPIVPGIVSYRVLVSSFRFGLGSTQQNP